MHRVQLSHGYDPSLPLSNPTPLEMGRVNISSRRNEKRSRVLHAGSFCYKIVFDLLSTLAKTGECIAVINIT